MLLVSRVRLSTRGGSAAACDRPYTKARGSHVLRGEQCSRVTLAKRGKWYGSIEVTIVFPDSARFSRSATVSNCLRDPPVPFNAERRLDTHLLQDGATGCNYGINYISFLTTIGAPVIGVSAGTSREG